MTLEQFHNELAKLLYIEDHNIIDVIVAAIMANSLQVGDPVWLTIIGPSSGGKSQLIRPFAMAHHEYIHRVDDLTPNTLLSGTLGVEGSLLGRIGSSGIISMDDLTVLFSKNAEQRAEILSQFRMLYDGRFAKSSGNRKEELSWEGHVGMIAGSTPSIYRYFAEVADMGERFISYRMKNINVQRAVEFVSSHGLSSKELNSRIADVIREFLPPLLIAVGKAKPEVSELIKSHIRTAAEHCTLLRTPVHLDERSGLVDEFPEPEMPFRVMKQLHCLAMGLLGIGVSEEKVIQCLEWTAYSLANDKRRAYVRAIVGLEYEGNKITSRNISAVTGLHNDVVTRGLAQLQVLGIIKLSLEEDNGRREYEVVNRGLCEFVRRLEPISIVINDYDEAMDVYA